MSLNKTRVFIFTARFSLFFDFYEILQEINELFNALLLNTKNEFLLIIHKD